jgi:hypothetical protein
MTPFNAKHFIDELAKELVGQFGRASGATTPGLVGSARERAVHVKLQSLLPSAAGVGSGCICDSDGQVSKQTDVVVFEKAYCPVFSFEPQSGANFYPCEGVIAAGEVKSTLNLSELKDSYTKCASAKMLRRHTDNSACFRNYGSPNWIEVVDTAEEHKFDQTRHLTDQLFYFILCGHLLVKPDTLLRQMKELSSATERSQLPNIIISLNDGTFSYYDAKGEALMGSIDSAGILYSAGGRFPYLLACLHWMITKGRTTHSLPFDRYVTGGALTLQAVRKLPWKT